MLSNAQIKLIRSLDQKKYRNIHGLYVAEGEKIVCEILESNVKYEKVLVTEKWIKKHKDLFEKNEKSITIISETILNKISFLHTPNEALALMPIQYPKLENVDFKGRLIIVLDQIQDPGNMGTIIRIADWFGIDTIVCSENCVDVYNPKVIQATMGAFLRVKIYYTKLIDFLKEQKSNNLPIYGATLNGEIIYTTKLTDYGIILMGNESKGIDENLLSLIDKPLFIPKYGGAESLNVSVATGIICSEFIRRKLNAK
jgi:TrmH family RNA methyltransferase